MKDNIPETGQIQSEKPHKRPWVKPSIAEEEEFKTFTLACASTAPCGISIPRS